MGEEGFTGLYDKAPASRQGPFRTKWLATPIGFEPTISTLTGWRVRPLHHGAAARMIVAARHGPAKPGPPAPLKSYHARVPRHSRDLAGNVSQFEIVVVFA